MATPAQSLSPAEHAFVKALFDGIKHKAKTIGWSEKLILSQAMSKDLNFDELPPAGQEMFIALGRKALQALNARSR